ncbi:acireductone synthase [Almyronema epifaneia]|uniref:Enolase-phosphatase E1 n=1 Tax=Almyronema epifaneia S1 TaxID=2991925 RepID=A0ABW6ICH3_9CYAN
MTYYPTDSIDVILLDIEGTTTPVSYVFETLFPFARDQVAAYLKTHGAEAAVQDDLALLRQEYAAEPTSGAAVPAWPENTPEAAVPYIHYLIACDRKSTALKSLQGKIWAKGYTAGQLQSQIFADVKPAFKRWTQLGKRLYIFSSGSVQAQRQLFGSTEVGDLTPYLSGYFDTRTGPKKEADSYRKIAAQIGRVPERILFISDVVAELRAAQQAGMHTLFSSRPGNHSNHSEGFKLITSFESV